jgi:hypothetical protein
MIRTVFSMVVLAALAGCGQEEVPVAPATHAPFEVAGLIVPGRLAEVKKAGFSECESGYYGYSCKRPFTIGGITGKAEVTLTGKPNMQVADYHLGGPEGDVRALKPEQLSYRAVKLRFADEKTFRQLLEKDGWVRVDRRRATYYVKPGLPVRWSVERHGIELEPILVEEVEAQLAEDKRKLDEKTKLEDNASAVVRQLQ